MAEECRNDSDRCTCVTRSIVAGGVVVVALLLGVLIVLLLPVAQGWRDTVAGRQMRAQLAAVHATAGDVSFASGRYDDAAMEYLLASTIDTADVTLTTRLYRAKIAGIAADPSLIDSINLVETSNEASLVASAFPEDLTTVQVVRALIKFKAGRVNDAVTILEETGRKDPDSAALHLANAVVWQTVPNLAASVSAEFDSVLAARPDDEVVQGMAGEFFLGSGQVDKGVALLRSASSKIRNLRWLKVLASYALSAGQTETALDDIKVANVMAPRDAEVLSLYGQAMINSGEFAQAVDVLQRAAAIRESREVLLQLGIAFNGLKAFDRSLPILTKIVQAAQDPISLYEYGNALVGTNHVPEAVKVYNAILSAPDGAGTQDENKVLIAIKEEVRSRLAGLQPVATSGR